MPLRRRRPGVVARQRLQGPPELLRDDSPRHTGVGPAGRRGREGRIRHPGGGRKRTVEHDPSLREDLDRLGADQPWGSRVPAKRQGHQVSHRRSPNCSDMGYRKPIQDPGGDGTPGPQRPDLQLSLGEPVISGPKIWGPSLGGSCVPRERRSKCWLLPDPDLAGSHGVYDIAQSRPGSVWGRTTIRLLLPSRASGVGGAAWGRRYPSATRLSNGYRLRLWKPELQNRASKFRLRFLAAGPTTFRTGL